MFISPHDYKTIEKVLGDPGLIDKVLSLISEYQTIEKERALRYAKFEVDLAEITAAVRKTVAVFPRSIKSRPICENCGRWPAVEQFYTTKFHVLCGRCNHDRENIIRSDYASEAPPEVPSAVRLRFVEIAKEIAAIWRP